MKVPVTLIALGALLVTLAGCGSSDPLPPLTLSCKTRVLPSGAVRAAIIVKRNTTTVQSAILYGPALRLITHEYPPLRTRFVNERTGTQQNTYIGVVVPRFTKAGTSYLLLRFARPRQPRRVFVTDVATVRSAPVAGTSCVIQ